MGLISECEHYFKTKSLYEVLSVKKSASPAELKRAFKKVSLLCHPDKVEENKKGEATRKFQVLVKVHYTLSDKENRALYDETGIVNDEDTCIVNDSSPDFWNNYFRNLFPKITEKQIVDYVSKYKGSKEEKEDLMKLYSKYEGNMDKISKCLIAYDIQDQGRYCEILNDLIEKGEIPSFPQFVKKSTKTQTKMYKRDRKVYGNLKSNGAFQMKQKKADKQYKMASSEAPINAIANRQEERKRQFEDMISDLVDKYGTEDAKKMDFLVLPQIANDSSTKRSKKGKDTSEVFFAVYSIISYVALQVKKQFTSSEDLMNVITSRREEREKQFEDMICDLVTKYGKKDTSKKKGKN